jgi:hypothetical protein
LTENASSTAPLKDALDASDEEGAVVALARALKGGATVEDIERTIIRAMAEDGEELHSMIYVSAAFDLAAGLGPEAGKYPLAAAAVQIARQPKDSRVYERVEEAREAAAGGGGSHSMGEVERRLADALDERSVPRAVEAAVALHRLGREASFVVNLFAKWAARPEVIEKPEGYVTHLPLQIDAALNLLHYTRDEEEADLLLGHLAFCQIELARRYRTRRIAAEPSGDLAKGGALAALRTAIQGQRLAELHGLVAAASTGAGSVEDTGRVVMRCALEASEGLGHRFTLADAARRIARELHPAVGRAILLNAALSVAHGYSGPRRLLELRDLPHATPGGRDYSGRLLVGITSGNLAEAHAALRGSFESGTAPRTIALSFLDAASHLDTHKLHTDHGFILTQAAWRAIADGSFAEAAVPLLADLAARLCKEPKDHELIQRVEDAWQDAPQAVT